MILRTTQNQQHYQKQRHFCVGRNPPCRMLQTIKQWMFNHIHNIYNTPIFTDSCLRRNDASLFCSSLKTFDKTTIL